MSLFVEDEWKDSPADFPWLITLRRVTEEHGCQIIFDISRHWQESIYFADYGKKGPTILGGGLTNPKYSCTAILHELGHHILKSGKRHPRDLLRGEEEAWKIAQRIALEHRLPFVSKIKRQGLYSYRYRLFYQDAPGSKQKYRRRPLPKSWQLENSKRTAEAGVTVGFSSMGKKGRRHAKRHIKRATSKAQRKRGKSVERQTKLSNH